MDRRQFFIGAGAAVVAPAVIRKSLIMPVKQIIERPTHKEVLYKTRQILIPSLIVQMYNKQNSMLANMQTNTWVGNHGS